MSESEVNPDMAVGENSNSDLALLDSLENGSYQKRYSDMTEVEAKIDEFSNWFNSTARLCLLRCHPADSESLDYLLLNLEKKIRHARFEINRSVSNQLKFFTCNVCGETVEIQPWQNVWSALQNHPHFEENYSQLGDFNVSENFENGDDSIVDDLSEDSSGLDLSQVTQPEPEEATNGFKFNFKILYDERIEELFYPDSLTVPTRWRDKVTEYTIQRCGVSRGVCLLCPCNLISRGRSKITAFVVKSHVSGQRHLKCAATSANINALKRYHEFWKSQEANYQAHQVHFMPEIHFLNGLKCRLCQIFVNYNAVIAHIDGSSHAGKIVKIFQSPEGKLNEFYLLDMQVQIYGEIVTTLEKVPKDAQTPGSSLPPKCVFVKNVVDLNNLSLPNRYKEHGRFLKKMGENHAVCTACKVSLDFNMAKIKYHISSAEHKQMSGLGFPKYTHFCEICNAHIKDEAAWDDHFVRGPNRHNNMSKVRREKVSEYECKTCKTVIYGDEMSLSRHISKSGKPGKAKEIKLPIAVTRLFRNTKIVQERSLELQTIAACVAEQQDKMKRCLESLEGALSEIYPSCRAYPFGSRISGLGNESSDLDVFIDIDGDMYLGEVNQDSESQQSLVKKVSKLLKTFKDVSYVLAIPSARTPIIRLHHSPTDLDCDISFRHGLGVENTKFLRFCIEVQPITQPFILLLKKWSKCCDLNEHIPNYGFSLLAVFYLQTRGYLPSVKKVRAYNPSQSLVIDGWETLNYTVPVEQMRQYVTPCTENVKQLLIDFFDYYAKFDYANMVVCPLLGNTLPKMLFNERPQENLPPDMNTYIRKIQNENAEEFRGLSPFCIQDPFDLSHNLTKACQHGTITKLKTFCAQTHNFLITLE